MRILFITDNFPPEVNAPATRTYEHATEWIKSGASVTVITCFPNYPQGRVYPGYKNKLYQKEVIDGIKVIRVWSYMTRNEGFVKRVMDYCSFAFMAFWAGLFKRTDVIVATSPQFFTTLTGYALSIAKRRPWVFELRDLWPDTIKAVSAIKNEGLLNKLEKLELFLYRKSNMVIAVTDEFKRNLVSRGIKEEKIKVVTNGSNLALFSPKPKNAEILAELKLENKFIVGYIGTHGMTHKLDFIIDCIPYIDNKNIHFLFIGDGAEKSVIVNKAHQLKLTNVTFLDPISKDLIAEYISITDVALVPLAKRDTFKTVIPSKIFESAAMRRPVLLGVEGQAQKIIEEFNAGVCFDPENRVSFLKQLAAISSDASLYSKLQDGCTALSKAYDRKILAASMLQHLKILSKK